MLNFSLYIVAASCQSEDALARLRDPEGGNPSIKKGRVVISYKNMWKDVMVPHRVNLIGWPAGMDLISPSQMQMDQLRTTYTLISKDPPEIQFVPLTEEEFAELSEAREEALRSGNNILPIFQSNPRKKLIIQALARGMGNVLAKRSSIAPTRQTLARRTNGRISVSTHPLVQIRHEGKFSRPRRSHQNVRPLLMPGLSPLATTFSYRRYSRV